MKCRKRGDEIMVNIRHSICQSIPRRWGRDTILSLLNFNLLSYTRSSAIYYYSRLSAIIFLLFLAAFAYSSLLHSLLTVSSQTSLCSHSFITFLCFFMFRFIQERDFFLDNKYFISMELYFIEVSKCMQIVNVNYVQVGRRE